jgi:tetratricopeptide (TPR) repeat protein
MNRITLTLLLLLTGIIYGRTQSIPDAARMAKMSPAELDAYKQQLLKQASSRARQLAAQYDRKIDETALPDFEVKAPVKDLKRLALIPPVAPSMTELFAAVRRSQQQLESVTPAPVVQEVRAMAAKEDGAGLQGAAIGQWLNNNPVQALLLSMESARKSPAELTAWNNLAAIYNMTGLQHKAIPILQRWLQQEPRNAMLLNNMGQAYLGLGDITKAKQWLQQCLSVDELNPEANRSMAMIASFAGQVDEAMQYFEKELQVAMRRSSLGHIKKMGRSVNLAAIRKRRSDIPHRDLFTEIGLDKFRIPDLPASTDGYAAWKTESSKLLKSLSAEYFFWLNAANTMARGTPEDGKRIPGLYADLADQLLGEHGDEYAPLLGIVRKEDVPAMQQIETDYWNKMDKNPCPQPPLDPLGGDRLIKAYAVKCCGLHKPIVDAYVSQSNAFIGSRINLALANWKSYVNGWIDIVQLDPSTGGKMGVYKVVADYFAFLIGAVQAVTAEPPPAECMIKMSIEEADAIISAKHDIELNCPDWLSLKYDIGPFSLSADCSKFAVEGGEGILGGYEKNFRTGVCTLSLGIGEKANFQNAFKATLKQMVYISFDNNNQMTDLGLKGSSQVSTDIGGLKAGYSLGLHSGFSAAVNGKGILKSFVNLSTQQ